MPAALALLAHQPENHLPRQLFLGGWKVPFLQGGRHDLQWRLSQWLVAPSLGGQSGLCMAGSHHEQSTLVFACGWGPLRQYIELVLVPIRGHDLRFSQAAKAVLVPKRLDGEEKEYAGKTLGVFPMVQDKGKVRATADVLMSDVMGLGDILRRRECRHVTPVTGTCVPWAVLGPSYSPIFYSPSLLLSCAFLPSSALN